MGDRKICTPIHEETNPGASENSVLPTPQEPSPKTNDYESSTLGGRHGGRHLRQANGPGDVEQVISLSSLEKYRRKSSGNASRIDPEVARYASNVKVQISEEENTRLRKMIDIRILTVMVFVSVLATTSLGTQKLTTFYTYFIQALDKGSMSFVSIMHIREDLHLKGQQVDSPIISHTI
jgi:hypothetical protein